MAARLGTLATLLAICVGSLLNLSHSLSAQNPAPNLADLAFVTDDDASNAFGCDSITAVDIRSGEHVSDGRQLVSPGRLTISTGAKWILSQGNNNALFVAAAKLISIDPPKWTSTSIGGPFVQGAPIEISPDDQSVVVTYPNRITKYSLVDVRPTGFGPEIGSYSVTGVSALVYTSDSRRIVVIRLDGTIEIVDAQSLTPLRTDISYIPIAAPAQRRLRQTYATITKDDRYVLINSGTSRLNIVDITSGLSWSIALTNVQQSYGIIVDYAIERDIFAVHALSKIAVYELLNGHSVQNLGTIDVPVQLPGRGAPLPGDERYYRVGAIAWTTRGDGLIATIGGADEFRVVDVLWTGDRISLRKRIDFEGCESPLHIEAGIDVVTLNRRFRTPTPSATHTIPPPAITVTHTPLPSTATASPSISPTITLTHTSTPTPSRTPTLAPSPIYLPISLRERCTPAQQHTDIVLVIDASTSMRDVDASGIAKLDAAVAAARAFVALLALGGGDQAAVVQFNHDAELLQALTGDRAAIDAAFAAIHVQSETCLVCGVEAAATELASARRRPGNTAVMVVLTDGRSNPRPASEAEAAAGRAKAAGVTMFTIGLGEDVDAEALAAMAAPGGRFYRAPSAGELGGIYAEVAGAIPCPAGAFWGGR